MDTIANRTLRTLMSGVELSRDCSMLWRPGRILVRTPTGEVIEITARQLAPHDPDAQSLVATLAAIDAGDVE